MQIKFKYMGYIQTSYPLRSPEYVFERFIFV